MLFRFQASVSAIALAAALCVAGGAARSAEPTYADERIEAAFQPTSYVGIEGGFLLNDSDNTLSFDSDDDKFGDLSNLQPGDDGWQVGAEFGSRIDPTWDYRVGASLIDLGENTTTDGPTTFAETTQRIGYADVELGYRPDLGMNADVRLFGGLRALYASGSSTFSTDSSGDKLGNFEDETWGIGPRVGVGVAVPVVPERGISAVGSIAGAALFGNRTTDYTFTNSSDSADNKNQHFSTSETVWNADAMVGLNFALTTDAALTLGYKAQSFGNLSGTRSGVDQNGDYSDGGSGDVFVHGPFVKLTVSLD